MSLACASVPPVSPPNGVCVAIPCAPQHWGSLLRRALRSVELQTHVHMITDIVVVLSLTSHQGSCDDMRSKLAQWASSNPHRAIPTQLICDDHRGYTRGRNRNLAAKYCLSDWIAYVDADDEMQPDRVERMLGLLHEHNALLGLHSYSVVRGKNDHSAVHPAPTTSTRRGCPQQIGDYTRHSIRYYTNRTHDGRVVGPAVLAREARRSTKPMFMASVGKTHHGHVVVHRSVVDKVPVSESLIVGEDGDFVRRVVLGGYRAVWTEEELTVYHLSTSAKTMPATASLGNDGPLSSSPAKFSPEPFKSSQARSSPGLLAASARGLLARQASPIPSQHLKRDTRPLSHHARQASPTPSQHLKRDTPPLSHQLQRKLLPGSTGGRAPGSGSGSYRTRTPTPSGSPYGRGGGSAMTPARHSGPTLPSQVKPGQVKSSQPHRRVGAAGASRVGAAVNYPGFRQSPESVGQPASQPASQSASQPASQPVGQPASHSVREFLAD